MCWKLQLQPRLVRSGCKGSNLDQLDHGDLAKSVFPSLGASVHLAGGPIFGVEDCSDQSHLGTCFQVDSIWRGHRDVLAFSEDERPGLTIRQRWQLFRE